MLPLSCGECSYVIVSPVKDEGKYVEETLKSVISQTVQPKKWVIVDDGSRDNTQEIISRYDINYPFIQLVQHSRVGLRQAGSAVIRAFNRGYTFLGEVDYDFIVKLDCDLSFEPDYFEKLLGKFFEDSRLGIASGVYLEMDKACNWKKVVMPSYHAAGACKMIRRECFAEIGGFIISPGWDTVDEIRAMARGWKTTHFKNLQIKHHKAEGSGVGSLRTSVMHGEIYYLVGGDKLFLVLKALHRLSARPYLLNAAALIWGYLRAASERKTHLVNEAEARLYKTILRNRLRGRANRRCLARAE